MNAVQRESAAEPVGRVIGGHFELVRLLAQGNMGAVYEARNTTTLKRCAVKLLRTPGVSDDSPELKRFLRESRTSSLIESDHVVNVFDAGVDTETDAPYIVMELLRGEDLRELSARLGVLSPELVLRLALQVTTGLAKAHAHGVIHRDIKPANLFLTQRDSGDYLLKIVDFGIAKVKQNGAFESQERLTVDNRVIGTPAYMSPEQARGENEVGASTDVWALGVVMFELLSGRLPYAVSSPVAVLMGQVANGPLLDLRSVSTRVPDELAQIVARATERDLARRYPDAITMHEALRRVLDGDERISASLLTPLTNTEKTSLAPHLSSTIVGNDERVTRDLRKRRRTSSPKRRFWFLGFGLSTLAVVIIATLHSRTEAVDVNQASASAAPPQRPKTLAVPPSPMIEMQATSVTPQTGLIRASSTGLISSAASHGTTRVPIAAKLAPSAATTAAHSDSPSLHSGLSDKVDEFR